MRSILPIICITLSIDHQDSLLCIINLDQNMFQTTTQTAQITICYVRNYQTSKVQALYNTAPIVDTIVNLITNYL